MSMRNVVPDDLDLPLPRMGFPDRVVFPRACGRCGALLGQPHKESCDIDAPKPTRVHIPGEWQPPEYETAKNNHEYCEPDSTVPFHVGGSEVAVAMKCVGCGGNHFHVGTGGYATALKCVTCGWEEVIHDG